MRHPQRRRGLNDSPEFPRHVREKELGYWIE
jgi:hypothetical protein